MLIISSPFLKLVSSDALFCPYIPHPCSAHSTLPSHPCYHGLSVVMATDVFGITPSAILGVCFFLFAILFYDILRAYFPLLCYHREVCAEFPDAKQYDGSPLFAFPRPSPWPLSWVPLTLTYTERKTIATHGYDVALYLRFLATQTKLFAALTVFTAVVLYPTYITAENRYLPGDHPSRPHSIELVSLANVPDKSARLWVTLVCDIFVVTTICLFLYADMAKYNEYRRMYRADPNNPSNFAILIQNIPPRFRTTQYIYTVFENLLPGQVEDVHLVPDARHLVSLRHKYNQASVKKNRLIFVKETENSPSRRCLPLFKARNSDHESDEVEYNAKIAYLNGKMDVIRAEMETGLGDIKNRINSTHAAFVIFKTMKAATIASTAPIWTAGHLFHVSRAPEPRAVNWNWLIAAENTKRARKYLTFIIILSMTIIWIIPSSLIQALRDLVELISKQFPNAGITKFFREKPSIASFVQGVLPPLLLYIALLIVPHVMRLLVACERPHSKALMESKIRNYVLLFYLMSNFVYAVSIGSISSVEVWREIFADPSKIGSLLSVRVPAQATFLMKYVLVNSFFGSVMGMLNPGRLLVFPFTMTKAKTVEEKTAACGIFTQYPYAKMYAVGSMVASICFVYCTISPIICAVALLYFGLAYICTKQLLLYGHRPRYEGGGYLFRDGWTGVHVGLYIHQLSMIAIFSLKRAAAQAVLEALSLGGSIWFTWYCRRKFFKGGKHGSVLDMMGGIIGEAQVNKSFSELYVHPGVKPLDILEPEEKR